MPMQGPCPWPSPPSSLPEPTGLSVCRCPPTAADASRLWRRRSGRTTSKLRWRRLTVQEQPAARVLWNERPCSAPLLLPQCPAPACPALWRYSTRASPPAASLSSRRPGTAAQSPTPTRRPAPALRSSATTAGEPPRGRPERGALIRQSPNPVVPNTSNTRSPSSPR